MDYLFLIFIFITGLFLGKFLPSYFSKKGSNLATKEDIGKITKEIETVKNIYKNDYDLSKVERDFYNNMVNELQRFLTVIKRYERASGKGENSLTPEVFEKDSSLQYMWLEFKDKINLILAKAFVFLKEENYNLLKKSLGLSSNFSELRHSFLDAMRQSLHKDTKLKAKEDSLDIKY